MIAWFEQLNINPMVIGEFDDSALVKYFSQAGYGIFCAPTIIKSHLLNQFNVAAIGETHDIKERFFLISPEGKVKHLAVQQLINKGKELFNQNIG